MSRLAFDENNYRDHAIDYLDDLMAADERTAFEMAVAKNPEWSTYVEELRTTWRRARVVINEGAQKAPSRVRDHVLAEAGKRAAIMRDERAAKVSVSVASPSLWSWVKQNLLARPWFAPAFVATAAVGLYVFSQQTFKDARPSAVTAEAVKQEAFEEKAMLKSEEEAAPVAAAPKSVAEPIAEDKAVVSRRRQKVAPVNIPRESPSDSKRDLLDQQDELAPAKKSVANEFAKRKSLADDNTVADEGVAVGGAGIGTLAAPRKDAAKGFAQPPSGWSASAPSKVSAAAPKPQSALAESEESLVAPASLPPAPVASRAAASAGAAAPRVAQERKEERDTESSAGNVEPSLAELVIKAQNAERDEQWTVAVQTYRQLLRRFPADKNVPKWKQLLAAASAHLR
jgi:hypothetical protein